MLNAEERAPGTLYLVPTPIGNLKDITLRALEVLGAVSAIACEDTRHSLILLNHYDIRKPLIAFHKFNAQKAIPGILARLARGEDVALVTDAGMPCISDPGTELVCACREAGCPLTVLPGPSAGVAALALSGLAGGPFAFLGFLPEKPKERRELLERFRYVNCPVLVYASPHALAGDIAALYAAWGERGVVVCKELSKLNERAVRTTLSAGFSEEARGEYVLVVEGAEKPNGLLSLTPEEHLAHYLEAGIEKKEAVKRVAAERGVPKNEIYRLTVERPPEA